MKNRNLFNLLALLMILSGVACGGAENTSTVELRQDVQSAQSPRYRLGSTASSPAQSAEANADFSWEHLTAQGPASGVSPEVGERSGRSFFNFRDGLEHPYYILKPSTKG